MTITIENIEESKLRAQEATNSLAALLHHNIALSPLDNKKSIARKIDTLTSLKKYFLKSINTDEFTDNDELIKYMLFIENITDQIHKYEILIGRKNIETLRRIGKRFGEKHQEPVDLVH